MSLWSSTSTSKNDKRKNKEVSRLYAQLRTTCHLPETCRWNADGICCLHSSLMRFYILISSACHLHIVHCKISRDFRPKLTFELKSRDTSLLKTKRWNEVLSHITSNNNSGMCTAAVVVTGVYPSTHPWRSACWNTPPFRGQTNTCENITFPQLSLRPIKTDHARLGKGEQQRKGSWQFNVCFRVSFH